MNSVGPTGGHLSATQQMEVDQVAAFYSSAAYAHTFGTALRNDSHVDYLAEARLSALEHLNRRRKHKFSTSGERVASTYNLLASQ